ncbi:hypothetical protein [Spirosoma endbachense]|jgi:hypothetical protein|uniref:Uncharacterized protein n=1 Tax=Spirosoma endbachense TaxID=2666025 RepID=A0A6P1W1Q4_9BACT|nr:hypothetical protein [Spirosoma endbachense]QHV98242.1 hypothetical protein GJR95_25995 [Spirosoma endbachense]
MAKNAYKWLSDFKDRYKASPSFLASMDHELRKEYTKLTNKEFDILYLFIEFQDNLKYDKQTNEAALEASPRFVVNYAGEAIITWKHKYESNLILPADDIQPYEVSFKWSKLALPNLPTDKPAKEDLAKKLGLQLSYVLIDKTFIASLDISFHVQLEDPLIIETLSTHLGTIINEWNRLAAEDETKQKGFIHNLLLESIEQDVAIFTIDTGSSGYDGLKLILAELNDPVWGVRKVTID